MRGESYVEQYRKTASRNMRAWRGKLWSDTDLQFFQSFDITPYVFRDYRPYINQLISQQRTTRFKFDLVTQDSNSHRRFLQGKEEFLQEYGDDFSTLEEAENYYNEFGDDEYALAVTSFLQSIRTENKAKNIESSLFENGIIAGADFIKAFYGKKHNREGSLVFERKGIRNMFWDDNSTQYDLSDAEFIGEIHYKYANEIAVLYPDRADELKKHFEQYTNRRQGVQTRSLDPEYERFFKFESSMSEGPQAKLAELWTLETEERFEIVDNQDNIVKIADFGLSEEEIWDQLYQKVLLELTAELEQQEDYETLADPNLEGQVVSMAEERFELRSTQEPIWYKCVQSYDVLFEYQRSPYPHEQHPYTGYFPQYTDGFFTGVMDDIYDIVIALNKALMFREMMFAHGAKGMLVVNADMVAQSGYNIDDVAEAYTQMGSIMLVKVKPGQRLDNVFLQQSTLDKGLAEIASMIADYDRRLQHITGVTPAQLGMSQGDTPASRYRMQINEGQAANNLIFDNFVQTMELFYSKNIPILCEIMQTRPNHVLKVIGEQARPWVSLEIDNNFDIFSESIRAGHFALTVSAVEDNPQTNSARDATYMQLAMAGAIPLETAIKISNDPRKGMILREMRKDKEKRAKQEAALQVGLQMVQQIAMESGLDPQAATELVTKLQKARYAELQQQEQEQKRVGAQMGAIQSQSMQDSRMEAIEN